MAPSLTGIPFWKAAACGNDFLIAYMKDLPVSSDPVALTVRMCDRRNGIGADGVEWLSLCPDADVYADLINSDGSRAEVSGNGTRCVAALWHQDHPQSSARILTGAGIKSCRFLGASGAACHVEMDMGRPEILPPLQLNHGGGGVEGLRVSMGNPHFSVFVKAFSENWVDMGDELHRQPVFPQRTNVEFVRVLSNHVVEARFFERGAGPTQSSGTGSCAAAVAAVHAGHCSSPVEVRALGGSQTVRWEGNVFLTGSARLISRGEFFI